MQENDVEEQGFNYTANNVNKSQEATLIIHRYKDIIKTQNKKGIGNVGKEGQRLKKIKDTQHFFHDVRKGDQHFTLKFHFRTC